MAIKQAFSKVQAQHVQDTVGALERQMADVDAETLACQTRIEELSVLREKLVERKALYTGGELAESMSTYVEVHGSLLRDQ